MKQAPTIPQSELDVQRQHMRAVRALVEAHPRSYHIVTLGCQMNVRDSETIAGMLEEMGMTRADSREHAGLVLFNTCCVRENAENKALGNVIWLKELKKLNPDLLICVGGCMMQESGVADRLTGAYPFIDLIFGTHNTHRLPELLLRVLTERRPVSEVLDEDGAIAEGLPAKRLNRFQAFLTIMYGCDNFCSYCIVPYVRGRERSRALPDILDEAKRLLDDGVQEITLLGQNVNSYGGGGAAFAELLRRLDALGVPRVRFMTSHPKDLSDDLIAAFGELKCLMPALHLPVQAGNDRILEQMNRRYTREGYLGLVNRLRSIIPDIGLTTDLIVGFPGETEAEFEDTLSLVEQVRFDAAFTFIYSPRTGTAAASMPDETPMQAKTERIQRLIGAQQRISSEILRAQIGGTQKVLVEGPAARDPSMICGRTERNHMVNFGGDASAIGRIVDVDITGAGKNTLRGEQIRNQSI